MIDLRPAAGPRLTLRLSPRDEGLVAHGAASSGGEAAAGVRLPSLDDTRRMVSQPTFHEEVGRSLFRSLLPGALGDLYRAALAQATQDGERLTLELHFDHALAWIAQYPWELLHDGTRFVLPTGAVNLARGLPCSEPPPRPPKPAARRPMVALLVSARPADQPLLASEFDQLRAALQPLIAAHRLDLAYLLPPTWETLMDWLLAGAPDMVHFEGHGAVTRTGWLLFENANGASDPVDAAALGGAFYSTDLQLALLSASDDSHAAGESQLGHVAPALILAGLPAVVAMQQSLPSEAAFKFWRGFYDALLAGQNVESAVMAGRSQLLRSNYWHIPALYARTHHAPANPPPTLERRIDTAAPDSAPAHLPLRIGLWMRRPAAPPPTAEEARRLLAYERPPTVRRETIPAAPPLTAEAVTIRPGRVEARLSAPGSDIHLPATKTITVDNEIAPPPLWFSLTPRQVGPLEITLDLAQDDALIFSATRAIQITPGADGSPAIAILSYGAAPPIVIEPEPVIIPQPIEQHVGGYTEPEGDYDWPHRESQDRHTREKTDPPPLPTAQSHREQLDGVHDWTQAGEPPEQHDDLLVEGEKVRADSDEPALPLNPARRGAAQFPVPSLDEEPPVTARENRRMMIAALVLIALIVLALIVWQVII